MRWVLSGAVLLWILGAEAASAQTMLDQEQRLIDIHSLLLDLPPLEPPGAHRAFKVNLGLEVVTIPPIDGTTGGKRQITASDRTPLYPRPRVALGLPAPGDFSIFVGLSYIPPFSIEDVSTHYGAAEAGVAYASGRFAVGVRGHVLYAFSRSPVTDPTTRDTLETFAYGADLSSGYRFEQRWFSATPYAGVGVTHLHGRFRVTSDGVVLTSDDTDPIVNVGVRLVVRDRWEAVGELDAYPGRLIHPNFRLGYRFDLR